MENKEKADQRQEQDLLTAPLPIIEDTQSLNAILPDVDQDTLIEEDAVEKTAALNTRDLHDLSNLLIEENTASTSEPVSVQTSNKSDSENNESHNEKPLDKEQDPDTQESSSDSETLFTISDSKSQNNNTASDGESQTESSTPSYHSEQINLFDDNTGDTVFYSGSTVINDTKPVKQTKLSKPLIGLLIGLVLVGLLGIYCWGIYYYKNNFFPNTYISGYNMSNKSLDEALEILDNASQDRKVTIKGIDDVESEILASEVGLVLNESPDITKTLENQNVYAWPANLLISNGTFIESEHELDESALDEKINSLSVVSGDQVVKTQNAGVRYNGREYVIREEVYGTEVNVPLLRQTILDALIDGKDVISLQADDLYVKPVTLSDNETLNQSVETLNHALNTVVTYDFQIAQETLDKETFSNWMSTNDLGEITFDNEQLGTYIKGLADQYDTYGKPVVFTTTGGQDRQYTELYSGWEIDQTGEAQQLQSVILAGDSVTREPVYLSTGKDRSLGNKIEGTYLEISIPSQTMWYYKDGELIISTPVVTGDEYQGYGTSKGYFRLQDKATNVVLRGDNADGSQYASPVTFWMPFHNGDGVHDASWRSSYGGSIYLGNGSHGCVNTPYSAVRTIFNNISVGDPVIVY